jgi:hypothetical protein
VSGVACETPCTCTLTETVLPEAKRSNHVVNEWNSLAACCVLTVEICVSCFRNLHLLYSVFYRNLSKLSAREFVTGRVAMRLTVMLPQIRMLVKVNVNVTFTLRLAVYSRSVRLGVKPLETHD